MNLPPTKKDMQDQLPKLLWMGAVLTLLFSIPAVLPLEAQQKSRSFEERSGIIADWDFASVASGFVLERVTGTQDPIVGVSDLVQGPAGAALLMDGYTTSIRVKPIGILSQQSDFSISCWLQVEAYPWNELPILDQNGPTRAFFFGIDAEGHLIASIVGKTERHRIITAESLPMRRWILVTLNAPGEGKLSITIDGRDLVTEEALIQSIGASDSAQQPSVLIGHVRQPLLPGPPNAVHPQLPVEYSLQGSLGGLTVYDHLLRSDEVSTLLAVRSKNKSLLEQMPWPKFPRGPEGVGNFGAFYTSLKFDRVWDATRRVGPDCDIVVRFPDAPIQLVFWQGANYVPSWVTENNRWYTDEFMEIYGNPRCPDGEDCEPMSDKQVRYSHVRILENTPARAVIHWRYALSEVEHYRIADAPSPVSWGDWADEYWTVYPDGVAIRRQILWSTVAERDRTEFQESIVLIPGGERPEDSINFEALTFANLKGEEHTYTWEPKNGKGLAIPKGPYSFTDPAEAVIQWVNLKSVWKPFQIAWGSPVTFDAYNRERSISAFEWWNHWPVAQIPSSGRPALAADRPGHTSLSHIYWPIFDQNKQHIEKIIMTGLTTMQAKQLAPVAKSWRQPAPAHTTGGATIRYDPSQRAYTIIGSGGGTFSITLHGSKENPIRNPAFVIDGWLGQARVSATNGSSAVPANAKIGYIEGLKCRKMVTFLEIASDQDITITISSDK